MDALKLFFLFLPIALMGCCVGISAHAASFDCMKAGSKVEHIICDNPEISSLDDELNTAYKAALQDKQQARSVRQAQKKWIIERNNCADANCVKRIYENRLSSLKKSAESSGRKKLFVVSEGKGYAVCESYVGFLNSLPESEPLPLCHLKRSPDFPGLKDPDWEEMDISSNLQLVYMLEKKLSPSMHDRPVDTFDHWKDAYEQQIKSGEALPRLRRTRLALLPDSPLETILAYEPDRASCDKTVHRQGYAYSGANTAFYVWDEQTQQFAGYGKQLAFGMPLELMLFRGTPLLFSTHWGKDVNKGWVGKIYVNHLVSAGIGNQYGSVQRCLITFKLPPMIIERMKK